MIIPIAEQRETQRYPVVTVTLIALNVLVYAWELLAGDDAVKAWCYVPLHPTLLTSFTSMFLHGGLLHLAGNMLFLWMVGPNIEEAFSPFGMLALYLVAGCFADFAHAHMIAADGMDVPTLGASGAIAGLMGASIVIFPLTKVKFWYWIGWFWRGTFEVDAFWAIGVWFVQQLVLNETDGGGGVAYGAHIGGFGLSAAVAISLVLTQVVEPHWDRPENWPQRSRSMRPEIPAADLVARHRQHMQTARAVAWTLGVVVLLSGSVKAAIAYRTWRVAQEVHFRMIVPTSDQRRR